MRYAAATVAALAITIRRHRDVAVVELVGELDLAGIDAVRDAIAGAREDDCARLALDLSGLSFLDSSGVRLLVEVDRAERAAGRELLVVRGGEAVQRVLALTRVDERLTILDDLSSD